MAKTKNKFGSLADAFAVSDATTPRDSVGRARVELHPETMMPMAMKKPQTPAQHASVEKAAAVSAQHRRKFGPPKPPGMPKLTKLPKIF